MPQKKAPPVKNRSSKSSLRRTKAPTAPSPSKLQAEDGYSESEVSTTESVNPGSLDFPVVGIGGSAGGYEAFVPLLARLPRDSGMAFVVVQHLDPKHESKLSELLARSASLPLTEAKQGVA